MLTNLLYNTIIELVIAASLLIWLVFGCTILIPFLFALNGYDYWDLRQYIEEMRGFKIKRSQSK